MLQISALFWIGLETASLQAQILAPINKLNCAYYNFSEIDVVAWPFKPSILETEVGEW